MDKATMSRVVAVVALLAATCGGGDKQADTIHGTAEGLSFEGKAAAFDSVGQALAMVSIADIVGICQLAEAGMPPPGDLQWLSVFFCMATTDPTGEYQILPGNPWEPCDGKIAWANLRRFSGGATSVLAADGGSARIDVYSQHDLKGGASVVFKDQSLTGLFAAQFCAALNWP